MATRQQNANTYMRGEPLELLGSFQTNGSGAPTIFRDGHALITSVTRVSTGLFEVTFDSQTMVPELPVIMMAWVNAAASPPTICPDAFVIDSTWDKVNKKFRITTVTNGSIGGAAVAPSVADPDSGARIGFRIVGSVNSAGTDLA